MASITEGRVECPVKCGHMAAQVKIKTDKAEGREAHPYVHCAGCGIQLHARNRDQAAHIRAMMRPVEPVAAPVLAPVAAPVVTAEPAKTLKSAQEATKPRPMNKVAQPLQKAPVAPPVASKSLFGGIFG